jgi:hypothetical protein
VVAHFPDGDEFPARLSSVRRLSIAKLVGSATSTRLPTRERRLTKADECAGRVAGWCARRTSRIRLESRWSRFFSVHSTILDEDPHSYQSKARSASLRLTLLTASSAVRSSSERRTSKPVVKQLRFRADLVQGEAHAGDPGLATFAG